MNKEVQYLGYRLTAAGIHASEGKVKAIDQFPTPENKQSLNKCNGMAKYFHRFLPCVSRVMAPLYVLKKERSVWSSGEKEEKALLETKKFT